MDVPDLPCSEESIKSKQLEDQRLGNWDTSLMRISNKFLVGTRVSTGTFGEVRLGKSLQTDEDVIVKLELLGSKVPTLIQEYRFYNKLGFANGKKRNFFLLYVAITIIYRMTFLYTSSIKIVKIFSNF